MHKLVVSWYGDNSTIDEMFPNTKITDMADIFIEKARYTVNYAIAPCFRITKRASNFIWIVMAFYIENEKKVIQEFEIDLAIRFWEKLQVRYWNAMFFGATNYF